MCIELYIYSLTVACVKHCTYTGVLLHVYRTVHIELYCCMRTELYIYRCSATCIQNCTHTGLMLHVYITVQI